MSCNMAKEASDKAKMEGDKVAREHEECPDKAKSDLSGAIEMETVEVEKEAFTEPKVVTTSV